MDIHLLMEGEEVGPLSEAQVRQYLDEGLLSTTDLATYEGMEDWLPLELVLAHLPPFVPTTETVLASETETETASESSVPAAPPETETETAESPFIMPNENTGSFETTSLPLSPEITLPLTASQKTKRSKIVLQPILPLETTLPLKKKSGKTALTLEPMRSTISLPSITGHQPRDKTSGKGAGRTGKVSLRVSPEQPLTAPLPAPTVTATPEPELEPVAKSEPAPVPEPVFMLKPATPPEAEPEPELKPEPLPQTESGPIAVADEPVAPVEAIPPVASAPLVEPVSPQPTPSPAASPASPSSGSPSQKLPDPTPHFSVLPKGAAFMPPSVRKVGGIPSRGRSRSKFPYAGVALVLFVVFVIGACVVLFSSRGGTAPTPNPFVPQNVPAPPLHSSIQAPEAGAPTAADFSERGLKLQAAGDLDGAIQDFDQALALDPKADEIFYQRGQARQAKHDMPGAIADYTQVLALNPKRANAFSNRGFIKQNTGDLDGALADYAQALAINPKSPVVYNNIGLIKVKKGDLDGAIAAYNRTIDLDPTMAFAFYNRGVAKNTEGNVDGAIADFTQAVTVNPKIALAYCNRGIARQSKGDTDGALSDYSQALSLDSSLTDAYYNRGLIKTLNGDFDGAVDDTNHVLTIDTKYAPAYHQRGLAMVGKNRPAAALNDFKEFCDLVPRDPAADSARLFTWLMATESNANGDTDANLTSALQNDWNSPPEDLTSKIAAFLVGHITEGELIANAASPDPAREPGQYCRVWYFTGMKRLLDGDTPTAVGYFQKSVATGRKDLNEYAFSQAELQAQSPTGGVTAMPDAAH